ncbi:MAG: hypothetical protein ACYCUI_15095 [Vulcanimicrobiaceae bacterium]
MKEIVDETTPSDLAVRCHEIQVGLGTTEVLEFDQLALVGMAVRLSLHIRGLSAIPFEVVKLVCYHYLDISQHAVQRVVELLAEIEFVKLGTEGKTIKTVLPNVPYYEQLYEQLGGYACDAGLNEAEQLSIDLLQRLARSPQKLDSLRSKIGADTSLFDRSISVGKEGAYLRLVRARGRDVLLTPTYFSENPELYADAVAGGGADQIQKVLTAIRGAQGFPLSLVEKTKRIGSTELSEEEVRLTIRLAQDGVVRPPSLKTPHAGENFFLFTPTPSGAALASTKRDIYEKAMAIVSAVRQGQFLPQHFAIRNPGAILYTLRSELKLRGATTEAAAQYKNLVYLRIARLADAGSGFKQLHIIDTEENREALEIAYRLVDEGIAKGIEVDEDARKAIQQDQSFVDSLVASGKLKKARKVALSESQQQQLDLIFLK